jgi:hypothetical protein
MTTLTVGALTGEGDPFRFRLIAGEGGGGTSANESVLTKRKEDKLGRLTCFSSTACFSCHLYPFTEISQPRKWLVDLMGLRFSDEGLSEGMWLGVQVALATDFRKYG